MRDHEAAMLTYVQLAAVSQQKRQPWGCVRFLVLAGGAACRAGWPEVANRCRELVLVHNPRHLLGRYADVPDAMRADEFTSLLKQMERLCPYERAEHLLRQVDAPSRPDVPNTDESPGAAALRILSQSIWQDAAGRSD